jgi:signal transduction histidine kinase
MTGMSGLELLERARELCPDSTRVLVTAYSDTGPILEAINRAQVDRFLIKPWDAREMEQLLVLGLEQYELKRRLRELQLEMIGSQRVEAMSRLSAALFHDLASPLSAVSANAERLRDMSPDLKAFLASSEGRRLTPEVRELLTEVDDIGVDLHSAATFMVDLVTSARTAWRAPSADVSTDLTVVVPFVAKLLGPRLRLDGAHLEWSLAPELPRVRMAPVELCQILSNLLTNSAQAYLPEATDRRVLLSCRPVGDGVLLEVKDFGRGIPKEVLEKLGTTQITTKGEGVGTGLGMLILGELTRRSGGSFVIESTVGLGTSVQIRLPPPVPAPPEPAPEG